MDTVEQTSLTPARRHLGLGVRWCWLSFLLGLGLFLAWAAVRGWPGPIFGVDVEQHRANIAVPPPQPNSQIRQTFVPRHDGLAEVELLVARGETESDGRIQLQLLGPDGGTLAAQGWKSRSLNHNQTLRLRFASQPNSAGQHYTLLLSGSAGNPASVWAYDLDVHAGGTLTLVGSQTAAQDLRFVTRYRLSPAAALLAIYQSLASGGGLMLVALAFLILPGCLLLTLARRWTVRWDPAAWWGAALALGTASWPLLWLWLTVAGGRWRTGSLWAIFVAGWLLAVGLWRFGKKGRWPAAGIGPPLTHLRWQHGILLLLLLVGLAVRLLAVRDLAFPPWVDSSRHALITAVMAEKGQALSDYTPLLPVDSFPYHFGFHTLSASLSLMTGVDLPPLLLVLGQLLNALVPLTIYAASWLLTRRPGVGLLAAFLVALPFFFPAYYATWGRLTQLTAMLVLPVTLALTWLLIRGARRWGHFWWLLALLIAGLFLTHFRVFLIYCPFAGLVWLITLGRRGRWLALSAGLAILLTGPRILELASGRSSGTIFDTIPGYNEFPIGYVTAGWERGFWWLAAAALLLAAVAGLRQKRWALLPLCLAAWAGLIVLVLSGSRLGLPETWLINLNSAYITFFLPQALVLGIVADRLRRWLATRPKLVQLAGYALTGAALTAAAIFGLRQQVTILNPQTILTRPQDLEALAWLDENVPLSARVAVNSWRWLGNTWAGSDGGAWIVPLTRRNSTTPPADYIYNSDLAKRVSDFNESASAVTDWSDPAEARWLRRYGVSHVFVGARGGFFDPADLFRNPQVNLRYSQDGVFIFELHQS